MKWNEVPIHMMPTITCAQRKARLIQSAMIGSMAIPSANPLVPGTRSIYQSRLWLPTPLPVILRKIIFKESATMPDTEDLAIFVRVVDLGSLSAAGRDRRLSAAVVSNRIARLEKTVGTRLLNRTTRHVSLTEDGSRYYEHCVIILNELEQAESALDAITSEPRGPIKVTVPSVFGRLHIAPHLPQFVERHPQMQVRPHITHTLLAR